MLPGTCSVKRTINISTDILRCGFVNTSRPDQDRSHGEPANAVCVVEDLDHVMCSVVLSLSDEERAALGSIGLQKVLAWFQVKDEAIYFSESSSSRWFLAGRSIAAYECRRHFVPTQTRSDPFNFLKTGYNTGVTKTLSFRCKFSCSIQTQTPSNASLRSVMQRCHHSCLPFRIPQRHLFLCPSLYL